MKRLNNAGLSLVELLIAMAISSIVIVSLAFILTSTTRQYDYVENDTTLQSEAQIIMNHISDKALEGNNVSYDASKQLLTVYHTNLPDTPGGSAAFGRRELIWYKQDINKMYLFIADTETELTAAETVINNNMNPVFDNLMGEYVTEFTCEGADETGLTGTKVKVKIKLERNGMEYELEDEIALRNRIIAIETS